MDNVGESNARNRAFKEAFSRLTIIQNTVKTMDRDAVIFDIGGHIGESIVYFRGLFPGALIYSFEPDPDSFVKLKAFADEKTFCYNIALSDTTGPVDFFRNRIGHTNSLLPVNMSSKDSIYFQKARNAQEAWEPDRFNQKTVVNAMRLDEFCVEHRIEQIDLLKVDVQGAETKVLNGGVRILERVKNIIVEISFFDYYSQQSSFCDVEKSINIFGFKLYAITEISNNPMNGRTDWAEVIYTKTGEKPV